MKFRHGLGPAEIADQLGEAQEERENSGGEAAHRDHEGEPSTVGMWALAANPTEDGQHEQRGDGSRKEDDDAGGEELACIWLHRGD
jgi:hypothetical protein